ncbi:MAG: FG-GAP-like repeat-containing protein [Bryobacteraceae bacterium]
MPDTDHTFDAYIEVFADRAIIKPDNGPQYEVKFKPGQTFLDYVNSMCVNGFYGLGPSPPSLAVPRRDAARAMPNVSGIGSTTNSGLGSQIMTGAPLANGSLVVAWVDTNANTLDTAILSADGSSYVTSQTFPLGSNPQQVISGDFNGDGNIDLAVTNYGSDTGVGGNVAIFFGKGDGTFTVGPTSNAGTAPVSLVAADFNGDNNLDLAVANQLSGGISVMLGNGNGTFQAAVPYLLADYTAACGFRCFPSSLVAMAFTGGGNPDIAVLDQGTATVSILINKGNGTFKPAVAYPAGQGTVTYLASMDLNGDGNPDLIVANMGNPGTSALSFLFGNGNGTFQAPVMYAIGASPEYFGIQPASDGAVILTMDAVAGNPQVLAVNSNGVAGSGQIYIVPQPPTGIAAGDISGDGLPDIAVANGVVSVLLRNPSAAFNAPVNYPLQSGSSAAAVAVADLTGNGPNDVVASSTTSAGGGTVDVLMNNGEGTLGTQYSYAIGGSAGGTLGQASSGLVVADFGNGKQDVAAGFQGANNAPGGVSVLLGNGDGTLHTAVNYSVGAFSALDIVAGDFNGDGNLDIAVAAGASGSNFSSPGAVALLLGKGDGTFQNAALMQVGSPAGTPVAIAAADVNNDGNLDLVVSVFDPSFNNTIVVLLGNGNGTFSQLSPISIPGVSGDAVALADLNADGIPDLVVGACCGLSESVYLLGNGDGTFQSPQYFSSGDAVVAMTVADWNLDGNVGMAFAQQAGTVMAMESGLNPKVSGFLRVVSAAAGVAALAPGELASAYGLGLATGQPVSEAPPGSISVGGTTVTVKDSSGASTMAPLFYVSPSQVNYQIPGTVALGAATVTVTAENGTSVYSPTTLTLLAPAVFAMNSTNLVAATAVCVSSGGTDTNEYPYQVVNGAIVAKALNLSGCAKTVLQIYATGMDQATASGVTAAIGGTAATVESAGPEGSWPGLDQIDVDIPASLAGRGRVPLTLSAGGMTSNTAYVNIQ